jgi:hypothetical protein
MFSAKVREKSIGMTKHMRVLHFFIVAVMVIIMAAAAPKVWADVVELDEAEIFFEENATDGDLGIQFFLDGEGWKRITIFTPDWRRSVTVSVKGKLGKIGLTEIFSESAEPSFDELPREEFLAMFPEGDYRFFGWTVEGDWLTGTATLTKNLPDAPELDVEDFPVIKWETLGGPEVVGYEVVVELVVIEDGDDGDELVFVNTATFPGNVYEYEVPQAFLDLIEAAEDAETLEELKVEIIAKEKSGNKTITEKEIEIEGEEEIE